MICSIKIKCVNVSLDEDIVRNVGGVQSGVRTSAPAIEKIRANPCGGNSAIEE